MEIIFVSGIYIGFFYKYTVLKEICCRRAHTMIFNCILSIFAHFYVNGWMIVYKISCKIVKNRLFLVTRPIKNTF